VRGSGVSLIPLLFLALCLVGAAAWLWTLVCVVAAMCNFRNVGDAFSRRTLWNPMNGLLFPDLLTGRGKRLRRYAGYGLSVFIGCLALAGLMVLITVVVR
jgi:hypothetical protein